MKKSTLISVISVLLLSVVFMSSCGENKDKRPTVSLNVYNWGEYISDGSLDTLDSNAAFEEYFNENLASLYGFYVEVNYTTYATNEDMYSKIKSGAGTYDIIIPSDYMIQKMIAEDMLLEFDVAAEIENYV